MRFQPFCPARAVRLAGLALIGVHAPGALAQTQIATFANAPIASDFGFSSVNIGDLNGDGYPEIVIGAPRGGSDAPGGRIQVLDSRTGALVWERRSQESGAGLGLSVAVIKDLNGDGQDDLLVPAQGENANPFGAGAIRVLSGVDGSILREWLGPAGSAHSIGAKIAVLGDIDGDGFDEFAFTAEDDPASFFGVQSSVRIRSSLTGVDLYRLTGSQPDYERFASALASVGDIDGDGAGDVLIGSADSSRAGSRFGAADVYSGATGAVLLSFDGDETESDFGASVGSAGNFNGDGVPDFIIGAPSALYNGVYTGKAVAFSGADGSVLQEFLGTVPTSGFARIVGSPGDMDGDGLDEVFCASTTYSTAASLVGMVHVFNGSGDPLMRIDGPMLNHRFGYATSCGDVDQDGLDDIAVGSIWATNGGAVVAGRLEVFTLDPVNGGILCAGTPNSTGDRSRLAANSPSGYLAPANDLTLTVTGLPSQVLGYFLVSRGDGIVLFPGTSEGRLCISSTEFGRYSQNVLSSGGTGSVSLQPDTSQVPLATSSGTTAVAVQPGDTLNFQLWHRDLQPGQPPTDNFSDAVTVTFR